MMKPMRLLGRVAKIWGHEQIFASNDLYCGKFLNFDEGTKCSMHFHATKDETWYIMSGKFEVIWIDTKDASKHSEILTVGKTWRNTPLMPHQIICIEAGSILEVSTPDSVEDNYRVEPSGLRH